MLAKGHLRRPYQVLKGTLQRVARLIHVFTQFLNNMGTWQCLHLSVKGVLLKIMVYSIQSDKTKLDHDLWTEIFEVQKLIYAQVTQSLQRVT